MGGYTRERAFPNNYVKQFRVSKEKLYEAIWDRGQTINEFSIEIGYGASTIANTANNGWMSRRMIGAITSAGIPPEAYVLWADETGTESEKDINQSPTTKEKQTDDKPVATEDAMYRATYTAIMNTWSFIREDLKTIIKEALSE